MSFSKHPAPVSFLKARLRALQRPMVWGSGVILLLIVFFTVEYWLHPEWFDRTQSTANSDGGFNPSVSSEDGAIGADIDSLPVLLSELNRVAIDATQNASPEQNSPPTKKTTLFNELLKTEPQAASQNSGSPLTSNSTSNLQPSSTSPLLGTGRNLSGQPLVGTTAGLAGISSPSLSTPGMSTTAANSLLPTPRLTTTTPNLIPNPADAAGTTPPMPVSALQTALEQYQGSSNSAAPSPSGASTEPRSGNTVVTPSSANQTFPQPGAIAPPGNSGINYSSTPGISTPPPSNSFNYLNQPQSESGVPAGITPGIPTAPSIAPIVPSSNLNSSFGQSSFQGSQNNNGFNNSGFSGNAGLQPSQLNQQPFSVPRRVPGRNIGGGQINTFSNP